MPLFRRKTAPLLSRTSSLSVYGQGRAQALQKPKDSDNSRTAFSSFDLENRPHPLAFAEATFDPSLPIKTKSRLSKDLEEILRDNAALAYFIQYMDARKATHLIKFWLEAESFRISAEIKEKGQKSSLSCAAATFTTNKDYDKCHSSSLKNVDQTSLLSSNTEKLSVNTNHSIGEHILNNCTETDQLDGVCDSLFDDGHDKLICQSSVDSGCEDRPKDLIIQSGNDISESDSTREPSINLLKTHNYNENVKKDDLVEAGDPGVREGVVKLETSTKQDANAIYTKYIALNASHPIGIPNELRIAIHSILFHSPGDTDSQCFVRAQECVVKKMDKEYYPNFLRSSFHCKHQIDVLTSGDVFLADVLYNDSALFFFMEFMDQESVQHLVDFLLMADNFRKHLLSQQGSYDGMQAQTDAMVLYDKYFSLQATMPLGFSDSVRFELEANICQEKGPTPECFLKPVKILTQYLEKTYLLQFLNSQLYFKYISECIILIQSDGTDSATMVKATGSDSGSERSLPISSVNTLLAMDGKQPGSSKSSRNTDSTDMKIDLFQFNNDHLWYRTNSKKLQMAHVDHLGRVTTEFEPSDPERSKGSKITKAVKKLVNWEEDKNQEEMAWKVAERIVKDICSVTMPDTVYPFTTENSNNLPSF